MDSIAFEVEYTREGLRLIVRDAMVFEDVGDFWKRILFDLVADLIVNVVLKIDYFLKVFFFFWEGGSRSRGVCWKQQFLYSLFVFVWLWYFFLLLDFDWAKSLWNAEFLELKGLLHFEFWLEGEKFHQRGL